MCALSHTPSLRLIHSSTAGTEEGSPDHGNKGGWNPRMHWKGVRPVEVWVMEFWAYSAQGKNSDHRCCSQLQYVRRYLPISWFRRSTWPLAG